LQPVAANVLSRPPLFKRAVLIDANQIDPILKPAGNSHRWILCTLDRP
jgi:hypothetical protein